MRSAQEESSPFVDKGVEQEEHEGRPKVVDFPTGRGARLKDEIPDPGNSPDTNALSDNFTDIEQAMAEPPSREEIDAKLEAAEARTEARFAQLGGTIDVRFSNLDNKIDRLADSVVRLSSEIAESRHEVRGENRATRMSIIITVIASAIAVLGVMLAAQSNLLSAFQAGLAAKTFQFQLTPPKP